MLLIEQVTRELFIFNTQSTDRTKHSSSKLKSQVLVKLGFTVHVPFKKKKKNCPKRIRENKVEWPAKAEIRTIIFLLLVVGQFVVTWRS